MDGCGPGRQSSLSGRQAFYYPDTWPQDVIVHPESRFQFEHVWRPAAGRHYLFGFVGRPTSCIRGHLLRNWTTPHTPKDVYVTTNYHPSEAYSAILQQCKFCLVPDGDIHWTHRFLDVIVHGCVPVVISVSWHPPFHRLLQWTDPNFPILFVHPSRIPELHALLSKMDVNTWTNMQSLTLPLAAIL